MRRGNCLEAINESVNRPSYTASQVGVPEMRHFLYKCKSTAQFWSPALEPPYHTMEESQRLLGLYQALHHHLHAASRPLKLLHQQLDKETMLGWVRKLCHVPSSAGTGVQFAVTSRLTRGPTLPPASWLQETNHSCLQHQG